jgi:hypothetical protein
MMKRDQLLSDDRVSIGIDTFHDHRRNYWFDVNPFGIQMDGITTDGMDDFSFDTLWYSEGRLTEDGYMVLKRIPFKSLRFPKAPVQDWGIVLNRMIQRNNEMSCRPTRRLLPGWTSQFGHLEGLEKISPGRNLQFIPSILPNSTLVSLEKEKRLGADVLLTYMVNPGTALHMGFTDRYENLALDPMQPRYLYRIDRPETSVGRQIFIKLSYLFRV